MPSEDDASTPSPRGVRVNVTLLIVVTTVVSTTCSVVGGVWLYFESIDSLEGAVKDSSETEVEKLREAIMRTYEEVEAANGELRDLLLPAERPIIESSGSVPNTTTGWLGIPVADTEEWTNLVRWKAWSRIKNSKVVQEVGVVLVPWVREDPSGQYTHIWYDLKADESREYVFARYGQHLVPKAYNASAVPWVQPLVMVDALHEGNGTVSHYVYNYSFNTFEWPTRYGLPHDGDFTQYTDDTYAGDSFVRGEDGAVLQRFRPPKPWYASDRNPYVFSAFDVGYAPPPPPHPWSGYKQIWFQTYFVFRAWEETITEYALRAGNEDKTVMIYDQSTEVVYASTTGAKMINSECWAEDMRDGREITDCATHVVNMSAIERAGWRSAAGARTTRGARFWKDSLDGTEHFLRHTQLFTFMPAGGTPTVNTAILWLATTDSVQSKVFKALTVFILFACTVFVFDACMALFEIYLVAIPLSKIAHSLGNLQAFEPEVVMERAGEVSLSACLSVNEVYEVAKGLDLACRSLIEYKAFLPTTLFQEAEVTDDETNDGASRRSRETGGTATCDGTSITGSTVVGVVAPVATGLSLQPCNGTFAKVCFEAKERRQLMAADMLAAVTEAVEYAANVVKGVVHGVTACEPGVFVVSWNIAKKCADAPHKAAAFASLLRNEKTQLKVSVGLAHGTVTAGNVGSKTLRGFGMCGQVVDHLHAAQAYAGRLCREVGDSVVVLNERLGDLLTGMFKLRSVGVLTVDADKAVIMFSLKEETNHETQEWMYQLEEGTADPLLEYCTQISRTGSARVPSPRSELLCAEQNAALARARTGTLVECYKRNAFADC